MAQKELFINSVRQIRLDGQTVIPTVVLYKGKEHLVGHEALEHASDTSDIREDFKVEIGSASLSKLTQLQTSDNLTRGRSILGIAKDFIETIVEHALSSIERQGYDRPARILVAEPLSLSNDKLKRIPVILKHSLHA